MLFGFEDLFDFQPAQGTCAGTPLARGEITKPMSQAMLEFEN